MGVCDLEELLEERKRKKIEFRIEEILYILEKVLKAQQHLFRHGMIYCDLKPRNLVINRPNKNISYNEKNTYTRIYENFEVRLIDLSSIIFYKD